ncbi:MAG: hypothetical protein R3274_05115 [Desulfobacterales bacterium]|nr:hypothetical protein [Desulfobacterales bacterium]
MDKVKKARRRGADRRWTLLFIGDHGKQFTIKRFKVIIVTVGCVFLLLFVFLAVMFLGRQKTIAKHTDLQKQLQKSQQQVQALRHEKDILMARLVVAESKAKEADVANPQPKEKPMADKAAGNTPAPVSTTKQVLKTQQKKPAVGPGASPSADDAVSEAEAVMRVAVDNFNVSRDVSRGTVTAQFKIKNTSSGNLRADGVAVVILKGSDLTPYQWLVMPIVDLVGNKPTGKRGKRFVIQRFRTMNFVSQAPKHADRFQTAEVYIFSKSGEPLLEQDFAIKLPPLPVAAAEAPAAAPPPPEAKPAVTPPQPPSSQPKSAEQTPGSPSAAGQEPTEEDVFEELENAPPVF